MPIKPTVFIVGAGASAEIGLPIGADLRLTIARKLDIRFEDGYRLTAGDPLIVEALRYMVRENNPRDINPHLAAGRNISIAMRAGLAPSIDTFLDHHNNNALLVQMGKLGIARSILEAEALCALKHEPHGQSPELSNASQTWYPQFLNLIGSSTKADNLAAIFESITIICFNYDRCIEHYLYHAIQQKFLCSTGVARDLISRLRIFHPYGQVGALPWQQVEGARISFGEDPTAQSLVAVASQLRTFTERWEDKEALEEIEQSIVAADALVFLGFGYIPDNLALLKTLERCGGEDVFMTAVGISSPDRAHVQMDIRRSFFSDDTGTHDARFHVAETCSHMFQEHYRGLYSFVRR